jgi:hypothetical protein
VRGRAYAPLIAPATQIVRSRAEQLPNDRVGQQILEEIRAHFSDRWTDFETCAVVLWRMLAPATGAAAVTRASRDNGRDAVGIYQLGPVADRVSLDFVLEARCYAASTSVGVRGAPAEPASPPHTA